MRHEHGLEVAVDQRVAGVAQEEQEDRGVAVPTVDGLVQRVMQHRSGMGEPHDEEAQQHQSVQPPLPTRRIGVLRPRGVIVPCGPGGMSGLTTFGDLPCHSRAPSLIRSRIQSASTPSFQVSFLPSSRDRAL